MFRDKKIKILHLEDSLIDSELIHSLIESGGIGHDYLLTDNEKDFRNILGKENINIILSDYSLPNYNGNEALIVVREKYSNIPFIFVSGTMGEDAAINAMVNGATDYVLKNKLERLVPAIKRAINEHELETERKKIEAALHESETKYKDLINVVNDGYFVTNGQGIITFSNTSLARILGFSSSEELTGHYFTQFNKTSNTQEGTLNIKNLIENKTKLDVKEMEVLSVDGNSIYIEIKAIPILEDGKIAGMQGVIHDITERKLAEINLKEKNEQIEAQNNKYIQINKELVFQNKEKVKRAAELVIANKELSFQNDEKEKRADELMIANIKKAEEEKYKQLIEAKNKDITDSINYAKYLQTAKLPKKEEIYSSLPQCFVLFKPKDILSGDFYFYYKNNNTVFIVAADCTGHGVPGAYISLIGFEKLSDAFSQSNDSSEILNLLNRSIKKAFSQSDKSESTKDGMDIAICSMDTQNHILKYAGANIPLWLIRNGNTELEEIKGTKRAIGGLTDDNQFFESHEFKLQKGDTFYISSDGYSDQFSEKNGSRITKKKFKELLLEIQDKSMQEQEKQLDNFVDQWKGGMQQIDDILVIGVRL